MKKFVALSLAGGLAVTACTVPPQASAYCAERPMVCVLIGAVIVGGVVALANSQHHGGGGYYYASDQRLKQNPQLVDTLDNGIDLYAFRYVGDDRYFVGPLAQDLQQDPRFAHAVKAGPGGYLTVDAGALGFRMADGSLMQAAGQAAVARATN